MYGFRQFINYHGSNEELINVYLSNPNLHISEIANQFGKSKAEIYRILHANNVSPNRLKLNHEKVQQLRNLGYKIQEIAKFTGYTPRNVRYILSRSLNEG